MHRGQSRAKCRGIDANSVGVHERVDADIKCVCAALYRLEGGHDVLRSSDFDHDGLKPELSGRCLNLIPVQCAGWIVWIGQYRQPAQRRNNLAQELESLAGSVGLLLRWADD